MLLLACLVAGLSACALGDDASSIERPTGVTCERDHDALINLLVHPKPCTVTADCPSGSHCSLETRTCDWQCAADSDCGSSGLTCDCEGRCNGGSPPPGSTDECVRDPAVLSALSTAAGRRSCTFDADCPAGAGCNLGTGLCTVECTPGTCPSGTACDCNGRCVNGPPSPAVGAADDVGQLVLDPDYVLLTRNSAGAVQPGTANVRLVIGASTLPSGAATTSVRLEAEAGLELRCDATSAFASSCTLQSWTFAAQGTGFQATKTVTVRPAAGTAKTRWAVSLVAGLVNQRAQLLIGVDPVQPSQSIDGSYEGTISLEMPTDRFWIRPAEITPRAELPVHGFVREGKLVIVDPTQSVVEAEAFHANSPTSYNTTLIDGAAMQNLGSGSYQAVVEARPSTYDSRAGTLTGSVRVRTLKPYGLFDVETWRTFSSPVWKYSLRKVASIPAACTAGSGCLAGSVCDPVVSVCVAKSAAQATEADPVNSLVDLRRQTWEGSLAEFFTSLYSRVAVTDLAFPSGVPGGSPTYGYNPIFKRPMFGAHMLTRVPSNLGRLFCSDFMAQVQLESGGSFTFKKGNIRLRAPTNDPWGSGAPAACTTPGTPITTGYCDAIYGAGFVTATTCNAPVTNAAWTAELQAHYVPRLVPAGSTSCVATNITVTYTNPAQAAQFIALCPISVSNFTDSTISGEDDEYTDCFDETTSGRSFLLETNYYLPKAMPSSGGLECKKIRTPRTAEIFTAGDITNVPETTRADFLHECFDDLRRKPDTSVDWTTTSGALAQVFRRQKCFNAARFYLGNQAHVGGWPIREWMLVHAFLARETEQQLSTTEALKVSADMSQEERDATQDLPDVRQVLDEAEDGWLLFLSYSSTENDTNVPSGGYPIFGRFSDADKATLRSQIKIDDEQRKRMSTVALEGLTSHLRLMRRYLQETVGAKDYGGCAVSPAVRRDALLRAGRALRLGVVVESLASEPTYFQACPFAVQPFSCSIFAADGVCDTTQRLCVHSGDHTPVLTSEGTDPEGALRVQAVQELQAARANLTKTVSDLEKCGTEQFDPGLALYFGDVAGANAMAFASSDYLLNVWAKPAIETLRQVMGEARASWLAARSERIHDVETQYEREERLDAIANQYGSTILDLCGLPDMTARDALDALDPDHGTLTPDSCFFVPYCTDGSAACKRGQIGAAFVDIDGLTKNVEAARTRLSERFETYQREKDRCVRLQAGFAADESLTAQHDQEVAGLNAKIDDLREQKKKAEEHAARIGMATSALSAFGPGGVNPGQLAGAGLTALDSYQHQGMEPLDYAFKIESMERDIADKERAFSRVLTHREHTRQIEDCYFEADGVLVGVKSAALEIDAAAENVNAALVRLKNMLETLPRNVHEAAVAVDREMARQRPSVAHHHWMKETMARYERELEWSRLLTYYAARAVEYEFQQSLQGVDEVLTAKHPEELSVVIRDLEREQATRTINTRRPEKQSVVLSLRKDLLGIDDKTQSPSGEKRVSDVARFRDQLMSPANAIYDTQNHYVGQAIRFNLGDEIGLGSRCAERLWRVTATMQGDFSDVQAPEIPLYIQKRNTFYSHWCKGQSPDGSRFQTAVVRSSGNLLRPETIDTSEATGTGSVTAYLSAWLNVPRSDFYKDSYNEGSSEELAGRGLFGEYVLVFPWEGFLERGFPLRDTEDVLIRFDFVSVDNFEAGGQ